MANTTIQTTTNLSVEAKEFYDRALLTRLQGNLVYAKYAQKKGITGRNGNTVSFRRFNSLAAATTPLTEGVTPTGNKTTITEIKATPKQYGDYIPCSDILDLIGIDPVISENTKVLGEQAAETIDIVISDIVCTGTTVQYANGKTARNLLTAADKLTSLEVRKAVRTLRKNKAKPLEGKYYIGLISPDAEFDLMDDPLWKDVSTYAASSQIFDGEIGKLGGVRFVRASNNKEYPTGGASSAPVFTTIILGADAYGIVDVNGKVKPEMIVKQMGSAGTEDPLNQRATTGWKAYFTAIRLQELAILRIEHGATA